MNTTLRLLSLPLLASGLFLLSMAAAVTVTVAQGCQDGLGGWFLMMFPLPFASMAMIGVGITMRHASLS